MIHGNNIGFKKIIMSKKLFRIEMATTEYIYGDTKEEAIKKWNEKFDPNNHDHWHDYDFYMTGQVWDVPFENEDGKNWNTIIISKQKKV